MIKCFAVWFLSVCLVYSQESDPKLVFAGGASEISSKDNERASKAIQKWSAPEAFSVAPYYWDNSILGKPLFIRVIKNSNREGELEIWVKLGQQYELFKTYRVAYYSGDLGPKQKEGDGQAPEGFYYISRERMNPNSRYHLSMNMGYPNAYDQAHNCTGDHLMIHGFSVSIGCYTMSNCSIEQIYTLVDAALNSGQSFVRVHSFPFRMTEENLEKHKESEHYDFWVNLKQGWEWFEKYKTPPNVEVESNKYVFN